MKGKTDQLKLNSINIYKILRFSVHNQKKMLFLNQIDETHIMQLHFLDKSEQIQN